MTTHSHTTVQEAATRPPAGLDDLLRPVTVETFLAEYWERQPLLIQDRDPHIYDGLLTIGDIDAILDSSSLNDGDLRMVADGEETPISQMLPEGVEGKVNGLETLYARYRSGTTINLKFLHERWLPLGTLCRKLSTQLSVGSHGNVYLTPPGSQALTPHHDTHDVLVMQLYGSKRWSLHPTQVELPLREQGFVMPPDGAGDPILEFTLRPGDLAYLPRGTVHSAVANEVSSLHLTIGLSPMVWAHAARTAIEHVFSTDVRYRKALPVGYVVDPEIESDAAGKLATLIRELAEAVSPADAVGATARRTLQMRQPTLAGHLLDLEAVEAVDVDTPLRRRPGLQWRATSDDDELHLEFHGKSVDLPAFVEEEIAFIVKAGEFSAADIPGALDEPGRLVLVKRLLQEGFLTRA